MKKNTINNCSNISHHSNFQNIVKKFTVKKKKKFLQNFFGFTFTILVYLDVFICVY